MNLPDSLWAGLAQISSMSAWAVLLSKATLLLAIGWLIHFTLARVNPRWRVLLWRGVVIGLALLVVWSLGLPGLDVRVPAPEAAAMMPSRCLPSVVAGRAPAGVLQPAVLPTEVPASVEMTTTAHQASADRGQNAALPVGTSGPSRSWQAVLLGIWGFGVVLLVVRLAIGHLRLARLLLPTSQAAPEWVLAEVQRIAAAVACRRAVQVRSSRRFAVPFLYGSRGPVLVLPERMCQPAYRSQLPGIVAHELAHVRSWDFGWNVGLQIVSILLWFHPLAWRIGLAHRAACDAVCDAVSASYLGDVQVYCRTLAQVALEGAASFPVAGLAMARSCDVRRRIAMLDREVFTAPLNCSAAVGVALIGLLSLALLAGVRLALAESPPQASEGQAAEPSPQGPSAHVPKHERSPRTDDEPKAGLVGGRQVSAAALMRALYDGQAWIGAARSFQIRTEYKITHTDEQRRWQDKQPIRQPFGLGGKLDPRPFCSNIEWAWDANRIHHCTESHYEGDTKLNRHTRIWNGSLGVEFGESADHKQYVLGDKLSMFFNEQNVTHMAQLPWGPGGAYHFWWLPIDVANVRASQYVAPEDFELVGQEEVNGRRCYMVQSRAGHYRMHIGVADGRLYRRTCFVLREGKGGYNHLALCRKVGGASIKTVYHWEPWLGSLKPAERRRAYRELRIAEFEFAQPWLRQRFDDYREVAPGCWLAFRQTIDTYELGAPEKFLSSHSEQTVMEVAVNQPLAEDLFRITLTDGVRVATDWRYDPPIRYTYRKEQTEAERVALCEAERAERAEGQKELKKRQAVIEGRMGEAPPPLPESGWLNGPPLSWQQLRGKVVVLHFWDVNCGPCQNELPFLARWHENSAETDVVVIGIHLPSDDLAAVRKKLADFDAKYPVLIDSSATKPGGLGLLHDWFGNSWWPHTVLVNKRGLIAGHGQLWMGDIADQVRRLSVAESQPKENDGQAAASSEPKAREESPKDQGVPKTGTEGSVRPGYRPMKIRVFESDRNPVVNAGITVRAMTSVPYGPIRYRTNAEGIAVIEVPEHENLDLQLLIWAERRVTVGAVWRRSALKEAIPVEFTVTMEPGTTFGGIVRNEHGQPITGAEVTVSGRKQSRGGVLWWSINDTSRTDAEGKWQCHRVPADLKGFDVSIRVRHADYANTPAVDLGTLSVNELRSQSALMVMHKGIVVEGTVTDPQGRPVAGAMVGQFIDRHVSDYPRTTTDQNGHYRLPGCDPEEYVLAVVADGYAANSRRVRVSGDQRTFDLQLREGEPIRLRVVDQEGKPVAGAAVFTVLDRETLVLDNTRGALPGNDRNLVTDAEGRWSRLWIPKDELEFIIRKDGYGRVQKRFAPSEQEHVVTLEAGGWGVSGRVIDRETKAPVTKFRVVEGNAFGSGDNDMTWREGRLVENENGQYRATWDTSGNSRRVIRIEAEDYPPSEARRLKMNERQVTFNVELSKGQAVTGVVLSSAGEPLADAQVALCTATRGLYLKDGRPLQGQPHLIVRTGPDGHFSLPAQREPYILVVLHDQGFAQVEGKQGTKDIAIRPWARAEGTLRIGNQPGAKESIMLDFSEPPSRRQDLSPLKQIAKRIHFDYKTQTDSEGHFVFERVVPGNGQITRCVISKHGRTSSWTPTHSTRVDFAPGETTQVELRRNGRPVIGKLLAPKNAESVPVWHFAMTSLQGAGPPAPELPLPKHLDPKKDRQAVIKWWEAWKETPEGKRYQEEVKQYNQNAKARRPVDYGTRIQADGSFTFDDIPAGNYRLSVTLQAPPTKGQIAPGDVIATLTHVFTVPEMPGGRSDQPLELGILPLEPRGPR